MLNVFQNMPQVVSPKISPQVHFNPCPETSNTWYLKPNFQSKACSKTWFPEFSERCQTPKTRPKP